MTLPDRGSVPPAVPTNSISLSQLRTEYTDADADSKVKLSSFYYGNSQTSAYLAKNTCTDAVRGTANDATKHPGLTPHLEGIPEVSDPIGSQPIKLSQFYGKTYYYAPISPTKVTGDNSSYTFNPKTIENLSLKTNTENSAFMDLSLEKNDLRAASTDGVALTVQDKKRDHTSVCIILKSGSRIVGKGGAGGQGSCSSADGKKGGDAIKTNVHTFLKNSGRVLGGGGGGGGGGSFRIQWNECWVCGPTSRWYAGGGGGGGKGGGSGASSTTSGCPANFQAGGNSGSDGNYQNSGTGGQGGNQQVKGGNGGGWGEAGEDGTNSQRNGGEGGAAGRALIRKSGMFFKIISTGTISGTTTGTF